MLNTVLVRSDAFLKLELNALGDFLAGAFAPLALLWLVIGYFQQGDELRQNSRALLLQAAELRQAAEHAGGLLDVARREHELALETLRAEQLEREREAKRQEEEAKRQEEVRERLRKKKLQPQLSLSLSFIVASKGKARVELTNDGHGCSDFLLEIPANTVLKLLQPVKAETLKAHEVMFFEVVALQRLGTTPIIVHWTDDEGERYQLEFIATVAGTHIVFNKNTLGIPQLSN